MGTSLVDPRVGGGGRTDLGEVLLVSSPGGTPFRVRDVGGYPPYGEDPGVFPRPGGATDHRAPPPVTNQWELTLLSAGGCDKNSRVEELETYIAWRENTVAQYIDNRPIMEICLEADKCPEA